MLWVEGDFTGDFAAGSHASFKSCSWAMQVRAPEAGGQKTRLEPIFGIKGRELHDIALSCPLTGIQPAGVHTQPSSESLRGPAIPWVSELRASRNRKPQMHCRMLQALGPSNEAMF